MVLSASPDTAVSRFAGDGLPPDSVGGVRLALWNNKLGAAPTAMSLIAITRLQLELMDK